MKVKYYFENEDSEKCYPLEHHLEDAKLNGLKEIELLEAIPDNDNDEYVWCHIYDAVEMDTCKKSECPKYSSKSGRGICKYRGKLYSHGDKVKFKVNQLE